MAAIFAGSTDLLAGHRTSRWLGPLLRWLMPGLPEDRLGEVLLGLRKCAHAGEYAVLAALILMALGRGFQLLPRVWCWRRAGSAFLAAAAYAVTDEWHQSLVPTRQGSPVDVLIDATGAALGLLLLWAWGKRRRRG